MRFREMSVNDLEEILSEQKDIELVVDKKLIGLHDGTEIDLSKPREIPPTQMILTEDGIAHLFTYSPPTDEGRWDRFFVCVYALGGKVFYSRSDETEINASIKWK